MRVNKKKKTDKRVTWQDEIEIFGIYDQAIKIVSLPARQRFIVLPVGFLYLARGNLFSMVIIMVFGPEQSRTVGVRFAKGASFGIRLFPSVRTICCFRVYQPPVLRQSLTEKIVLAVTVHRCGTIFIFWLPLSFSSVYVFKSKFKYGFSSGTFSFYATNFVINVKNV